MQKIIKIILLIMLFMIATTIYSQNPCPGVPTVIYAGKTYNTVKIGTQCWLRENLDVGTMIQGSQDATNNGTIEKYCYNNNANNCNTYGGLYQWAETVQYKNGATNSISPNPAFNSNIQGICPTGWHIPTITEFQTLSTTVSGNGNALKAIGQGIENGVGTNTSGFSALLAGFRFINSSFFFLSTATYFWSVTEYDASYENFLSLPNNLSDLYFDKYRKDYGISVRCLKDESGTEVEDDYKKGLHTEYTLSQNYPNPFNPSTTINYSVSQTSIVTIKVYDVVGKEVATIVNENKPVGTYSVEFDASKLVSGTYFYRLQAGNFTVTKKLIFIK